tara:strand:- start:51442 stop:51582 length:141 start_codon:yes stop_codon:yes gene_type:complete
MAKAPSKVKKLKRLHVQLGRYEGNKEEQDKILRRIQTLKNTTTKQR